MSGGDAQLRVGFKRHLRAHVVRGDAVYLLSERGATSVSGAHVEALAPSARTAPVTSTELVRDSPAGISPAEIGTVVRRLVDAGLVTLRPAQETEADESALAYWESAGLDPTAAVRATAAARVDLVRVGGRSADAAAAATRCARPG